MQDGTVAAACENDDEMDVCLICYLVHQKWNNMSLIHQLMKRKNLSRVSQLLIVWEGHLMSRNWRLSGKQWQLYLFNHRVSGFIGWFNLRPFVGKQCSCICWIGLICISIAQSIKNTDGRSFGFRRCCGQLMEHVLVLHCSRGECADTPALSTSWFERVIFKRVSGCWNCCMSDKVWAVTFKWFKTKYDRITGKRLPFGTSDGTRSLRVKQYSLWRMTHSTE